MLTGCMFGPNDSKSRSNSNKERVIEYGLVTAGSNPLTVNLVNTYVNSVVVCSVKYSNNTIPVVTRVINMTSTSFNILLQNPSYN